MLANSTDAQRGWFMASIETGQATTIAVTLAEQVVDSTLALNGHHLVLWLRTKEDGALPIALPCDQLPSLIDHCAQGLAQHRPAPMPVTWFSSSVDRRSRELTLALSFGQGGTLSFVFSEAMAQALRATLQASHDKPQAAPAALAAS
jgi:hypothetical protein